MIRDTAKPAFLITIDTEGDNCWSRREGVTTENAKFLPRFQALCEKYGLKPTYLTNYEMAVDPFYIDFAKDALERETAEVGMHLHAWNSPPLAQPLTQNDNFHHPYLIEYPLEQIRAKVQLMTELLQETFNRKMLSHRAGRWSFDARYASVLADHGYIADCSVTPYVSWAAHGGDPQRNGGTDYRGASPDPYFMDTSDVSRAGAGPLLQIPMTVIPRLPITQRSAPSFVLANKWGQRLANRALPNDWLRPLPGRHERMHSVAKHCVDQKRPYAMFMTHSSELMPGGSPYFNSAQSVEENYDEIERLFAYVSENCRAMTVGEYANDYIAQARAA